MKASAATSTVQRILSTQGVKPVFLYGTGNLGRSLFQTFGHYTAMQGNIEELFPSPDG